MENKFMGLDSEKWFFERGKKLSVKVPFRLGKTYLVKPIVLDSDKNGVWPELAILSKLKKDGFDGVWVDTFHRRFWQGKNKLIEFNKLPQHIMKALGIKKGGRWDLVVWKGEEIQFVESKGLPCRDKIRQSQIDFKNGLLAKGFKEEDFKIIEWDYK